LPTPSPIWGSLPAPKMISTMTRIMINSDMPIVPNMVSFLCVKGLCSHGSEPEAQQSL
jgi:hypothetical protein